MYHCTKRGGSPPPRRRQHMRAHTPCLQHARTHTPNTCTHAQPTTTSMLTATPPPHTHAHTKGTGRELQHQAPVREALCREVPCYHRDRLWGHNHERQRREGQGQLLRHVRVQCLLPNEFCRIRVSLTWSGQALRGFDEGMQLLPPHPLIVVGLIILAVQSDDFRVSRHGRFSS
jgi:hypothetical protein